MGTRGPVLADRYHARILRSPREVRNALAYVLGNHRHHQASWPVPAPGLGRPQHGGGHPRGGRGGIDPYTSARAFDGWRGGHGPGHGGARCGAGTGPPADTPSGRSRTRPPPVPVATPRTWLLATGWRRHGLLEPA